MWLPLQQADSSSLPLIGSVRSKNSSGLTCSNDGFDRYKEHDTYRLTFTTTSPDKPALKALWIDTRTSEIWKVILSGYLPISLSEDQKKTLLADFEIELIQRGPYLVVDHVTWKYRYHQYDQYSNLFGEYYYTGFEFPSRLPPSVFQT